MAAARLPCLGCGALLGEGELFCLKCGGVPLSRADEASHAIVVGPIASMAFRTEAAKLLAAHTPRLTVEELTKRFAERTLFATHMDPTVGRALVARLRKIPAEAELVATSALAPAVGGQLFQPISMGWYVAGVVGSLVLGMVVGSIVGTLVLLGGLGMGLYVGLTRKLPIPNEVAQLPTRPSLPPQATDFAQALLAAKPEVKPQLTAVAQGTFKLLAAASAQGLGYSATMVDGLGAAVNEVLGEAVQMSQAALGGDAQAKARLDEIVAGVQAAASKVSTQALPEKSEQKLLGEAEIVNEVSKL